MFKKLFVLHRDTFNDITSAHYLHVDYLMEAIIR